MNTCKFRAAVGVAVAGLGLLAAPALARADPVTECQLTTANQGETGQCLQDTLGAAEAALALALQRAQIKADATDQATGRTGARPALDQAQQAWTSFRDLNCQVPAALAAGGSGADQFSTGCQIELTRARTDELDRWASKP
jgi:uncharacterized protein YecT (DUF1311 family)